VGGADHRAGLVAVCPAAELQSLVLVHYDRDFDEIGEVTGQGMSWLAPAGSTA
jgi:hypothetical protein